MRAPSAGSVRRSWASLAISDDFGRPAGGVAASGSCVCSSQPIVEPTLENTAFSRRTRGRASSVRRSRSWSCPHCSTIRVSRVKSAIPGCHCILAVSARSDSQPLQGCSGTQHPDWGKTSLTAPTRACLSCVTPGFAGAKTRLAAACAGWLEPQTAHYSSHDHVRPARYRRPDDRRRPVRHDVGVALARAARQPRRPAKPDDARHATGLCQGRDEGNLPPRQPTRRSTPRSRTRWAGRRWTT